MRINKLILMGLFCISLFLFLDGLIEAEDYENHENQMQKSYKYNSYIEKYKKPFEIVELLEENYLRDDGDELTKLAFELEDSQNRFLDYYNDKIFYDDNHRKVYKYFSEGFSKEAIDAIDDHRFKALMLEIYNSNYTLKKRFSNYEVAIDYDSYKKYYISMDTEGRSYFYIKEREVSNPYLIEGEFNIDLYELGDRIVETDDFILKYPFSKRVNEMLYLNTNRIWSILLGEEKSKVVDEDMIVKGNYRTLYRYLSSRISNKGLKRFLVGYIQLLENHEYRFDDLTSQYIKENDDFYNYDILNYEDEKIIIEYLDGKKMGGNYNYPRINGYSNTRAQQVFNEKLISIIEGKIDYGLHRGYYTGRMTFKSNYNISYNFDGLICFEIVTNYEYEDFKRVENIVRSMTVDFKSAKILSLEDIFLNLDEEREEILARVKEYISHSDDRLLINILDFKDISKLNFILNDDSVDLLYDVYNEDNNFIRTIKIPIYFDGLSIRSLK